MKKNEDIKWDASNPVRFTHIVFDGEIHKLDNMIKANELRIGNWVLAEGNPYKIKHISPDDEWEPIPLTPEILERAGFSELQTWYDKSGIVITDEMEFHFETPYAEQLSVKIEYLHQLQNLFFSLTGTELEINLK